MSDAGQKSEKATARRLQKARLEGQFAVSREFVSGFQFLLFVTILANWGGSWLHDTVVASRAVLGHVCRVNLGVRELNAVFHFLLMRTFMPMAIAASALFLAALALQLVATGGGLSLKKLGPDFQKLNPVTKLKQIPRQGIPSALQALALLVVFSLIIYYLAKQNLDKMLLLPLGRLEPAVLSVWRSIEDLLWKAAAAFVTLGLIDFVRQKRRYMKDLRMTKQEIREELKESEGNPQIKMRLRQIRRDLLRRKMMREVLTATAVIVNPTHFAVALRYDHDSMSAPLVVAKGKNYLALRIRKCAVENQVPLVENPPLAQALYKSVDVGQEIPPHLYKAVAEILAYIFRLTKMRVTR